MIETLLQPSSEKDHNLLNSTISNDFKVFYLQQAFSGVFFIMHSWHFQLT